MSFLVSLSSKKVQQSRLLRGSFRDLRSVLGALTLGYRICTYHVPIYKQHSHASPTKIFNTHFPSVASKVKFDKWELRLEPFWDLGEVKSSLVASYIC